MKRIIYQKGNKYDYKYVKRSPPYLQHDIASWNHNLTIFHQQLAKAVHLVPLEKGHWWRCKLAQPPGTEWLVSWLMVGMLFDQHLSNISPKRVAT